MREAEAAQRIDHQDQFHQVVVGRRAGRLDHEHVLAAHVLLDLDADLAVAEAPDHGTAEAQSQSLYDLLRQFRVGAASEEHHF
jgi:hypothetical protein